MPEAMGRLAAQFCGCGDPDAAWRAVYKELLRCGPARAANKLKKLRRYDGCWFIMAYLLHAHGLTEHGGTVTWSWLTPAGEEAMAFLRKYGPDWYDDKKHIFLDHDGTVRSSL